MKNDEQAIADTRINDFLTEVYSRLLPGGDGIDQELRAAYENLAATLGDATPTFDEVKQKIVHHLPGRKLLVINASVKRQGIAYGRGLNFLIGGNTLGRGIAIRDLLVTYYVRDARVSQIDTMHQHARMYGYRQRTLAYTRLFIPRHLYYRFRDIHQSDVDLRAFIERHEAQPATFPIEYTFNLRTTRAGVLDVNKVDTLNPEKQVYPNYVIVPQTARSYSNVLELLREHFGVNGGTEAQVETRAAAIAVEIDSDDAEALVKLIKTRSKNTWRDSSIATVIRKVAESFDDRITLRFRTAQRTVGQDGFFSTGTLSGDELRAARAASLPTLWIMSVTTRAGSAVGAGQRFMYPTFVIPSGFDKLYMFNRGS